MPLRIYASALPPPLQVARIFSPSTAPVINMKGRPNSLIRDPSNTSPQSHIRHNNRLPLCTIHITTNERQQIQVKKERFLFLRVHCLPDNSHISTGMEHKTRQSLHLNRIQSAQTS